MNVSSEYDCLKCKGKLWCGLKFCPIIHKHKAVKSAINVKEDFSGTAPSVFVGRTGYPNINLGLLSTSQTDTENYDNPSAWASADTSMQEIIQFRSSMINSRVKSLVKRRTPFLSIAQEVAMASKPASVDIELKEKPTLRLNYSLNAPPTGPNAPLKKAVLTANTKIPMKVDKLFDDNYLKAADAMQTLFNKGFDENYLSRLLSVGVFGLKKERRLVPTRWAITAADDTLGKQLIAEIKHLSEGDCQLYAGEYFGNHYFIAFLSGAWSYELFEMYMPNVGWNVNNELRYTTDSEPYIGRKTYAENCAGGYYTVRLASLEKLKSIKRQCSILAMRFVTDDYAVPLGVWVTREAARKALASRPANFDCAESLLHHVKSLLMQRWNFNIDEVLKKSRLLKERREQTRLTSYF